MVMVRRVRVRVRVRREWASSMNGRMWPCAMNGSISMCSVSEPILSLLSFSNENYLLQYFGRLHQWMILFMLVHG